MEKMKMQSKDRTQENFEKLKALFPNAVTETITGYDEDGNAIIERAIDKDVLQQEISAVVVEGRDERYQFTWPDKKKSILAANAPIRKTLRPCREESVDFDNTENLYIEGDNLDVLKLLQETYLGKVKMIYIDPPYNTGHDFVYNDDFKENTDEYMENSGQLDEEGNRLFQNTESNGRFHTDWLNMLYPRLKITRDLLSDDGVIFISIDDNEQENTKKICDEVFGPDNFVACFVWKSRQNKDNRNLTGVSIDHEYIMCYSKTFGNRKLKGADRNTHQYQNPDNDPRGPWTSANMAGLLSEDQRPNCHYDLINPATGINYGKPKMGWRYDQHTMERLISENRIIWPTTPDGRPRRKSFLSEVSNVLPGFSSVIGESTYTRTATKCIEELFDHRIFEFSKPEQIVRILIDQTTSEHDIILDFFSGSASSAHAVMRQNAEDNEYRRFIMVQLPELCDEKSEAYKAGYKNICEIGKERIRRAGKKIKEDNPLNTQNLDIGFRVLKLDSTNMKDVYYNPHDVQMSILDNLESNIKEDRTPEDLLFQVMLDLGVLLSSKIEESTIAGKKVFNVADNFLIACFDEDVSDETITAVAKLQPAYFVMRDSSMKNDSVATNFDQIFTTYSPDTVRKVI